MSRVVQIPPSQLPAATLQAIIEEYITREGTDYGRQEINLTAKVAQLHCQIERGDVVITFDFASESCNLMGRQQFQEMALE